MSSEVKFVVFHPDAPPDDGPSPYVPLEEPEAALAGLQGAGDRVIGRPRIRVLYTYPLGISGPSTTEKTLEGWVFEETAPNGQYFTRADVARAISQRYHALYAEERLTGRLAAECNALTNPGPHGHVHTVGRYMIWGHDLDALLLHTVRYDAAHDVFTLGIDS